MPALAPTVARPACSLRRSSAVALQPWEQARDKTLAAEREAASAHLASEKAQQHLKAAGAAQTVVQTEAEKHAQVR